MFNVERLVDAIALIAFFGTIWAFLVVAPLARDALRPKR
jgi:hypothetical protein